MIMKFPVFEYLWRFDFKFYGLPYFMYLTSKMRLSASTLLYVQRRLRATPAQIVFPLERSSVVRNNVPVFTLRQLKNIFNTPGFRDLPNKLFIHEGAPF